MLDKRHANWCCESRKSDLLVCLKFTRLAGADKIVHYLEIWTWTAAEVLVQNTRSLPSRQRPCLVTHSLLICFAARSQYLWAGWVLGRKGFSKLQNLSTSYQNVGMSRKKIRLFFERCTLVALAILGPGLIKRILDPHKYKVAAVWNSPISSTALPSLSQMPQLLFSMQSWTFSSNL